MTPGNTYIARTARADEVCDMAFVNALPKAELHIHIEGSMEPELMLRLAQRNAIALPYKDAAAVKAAYQFTNLQSFLDIYYKCADVLRTEADFYDLTIAYLARCHGKGIVRVEPFFDPQTHTERGIPIAVPIAGITRALEDGRDRYGISGALILSFLRHLSEEAAFETLAAAEPFLGSIAGVGLDSSEMGNPPEKFERVFAAAAAKGLKAVAHAGEEGPASYITGALDLLKVQRVDHGIRCTDDPAVVARLVEAQTPLTVCPFSNVALCCTPSLGEHNVLSLLDRGLRVTVNSDDPAFFGGYLDDNFAGMIQHLRMTRGQAAQLCANSIHGSFASDEEKRRWLTQIKDVAAARG